MENAQISIREGKLIKVSQRVVEGKKERIVSFIGRVMKVKGSGVNKTITVRQNIEGVDVDRIFPVASPTISGIALIEEKKSLAKKASKKKSKKK